MIAPKHVLGPLAYQGTRQAARTPCRACHERAEKSAPGASDYL